MMPPLPPGAPMMSPPPTPSVPPSPQTSQPTDILPMSTEDLQFWRLEIERARKLRTDTIAQWDVKGNLERYTPKTVMADNRQVVDARVNVAKDFSDVERKKAALFYDTPDVALIPDPGTNPSALGLHQELLNGLLGPKRMDCKATVLPTIQDCLVAIQPVPTEIGYTAVTVMVEQPQPIPSPDGGPPLLDATGQPLTAPAPVPVIVWEEFFWRKVSAAATLLPVTQKDTKYDASIWGGYDWEKPRSQAIRDYQMPPEWTGGSLLPDRPYFQPLGENKDSGEPLISGVKFWYRASTRDPNVSHPAVIRECVLIEGYDQPAVHRNLPYQEIGPDGRLTANSMIGYPLHPLALRDLTDAAYVAADCTITGPLTRELNKFRTQIIQRREGSKLHMLYDPSRINPEVRQKIEQNDTPTMIPVEPGSLDAGADKTMTEVPHLELGRESYLGQDIIERDRDGILGMNQNTSNPRGEGGKTATEIQTVQRNTDARFEQERQRVLQWWLAGVQKVSALVLRYGDRLAVEILGPERGQAWVQARDAGQFGRFSFKTVIDSGNYVDIEARKTSDLRLYNLTAKDPTLNRGVVQARLATDFGLDPAQWLVTTPPEHHPEPPTLSIAVKPEDLDPSLPSYVGTYAILTAGGIKGLPPPQALPVPAPPVPAPGEVPHAGMAELTPRLNQHQMDETGANSGPKVM